MKNSQDKLKEEILPDLHITLTADDQTRLAAIIDVAMRSAGIEVLQDVTALQTKLNEAHEATKTKK